MPDLGVSDSSKLQIQKQITTINHGMPSISTVFPIVQSYKFKSKSQLDMTAQGDNDGCFRQFKVTNSKANHNGDVQVVINNPGVSDSSKLQIQKQITTPYGWYLFCRRVFPIVQSYKFKSKSQPPRLPHACRPGVSDSSKLQIQKQITTATLTTHAFTRCFRQFKVTNSKANHN